MSLRPFRACWQRLWRAEAHYKALAEDWTRLIEEEPYSVSVRVDDDGAGGVWVRTHYDPLPDSFGLGFGEMLYQLRAALDGCIYAIAVVETGQDPPPDEDALEFPLASSPDQFKNKSWKIKPLSDKFRPLIESIQPYNAAKLSPNLRAISDALVLLNDWARIDRHRRLHLIGSWASKANPKLRLPPGVRLSSMTTIGDGFLGDESQIAAFKLEGWKPGMDIQANPDIMIDIAINEPPPPTESGDNLGRRAANMLSAVQALIGVFESGLEKGAR